MKTNTIYVASPIATYTTPRYDKIIKDIQDEFPTEDILPARGLYQDGPHFEATYRGHLDRCTGLVFFTDTDGTIGKGVYLEIKYMMDHGKPVTYWAEGHPRHEASARFKIISQGRNWKRYAQVSRP